MKKQQTAVEWLKDELFEKFKFSFSENILQQAKEIEKQQMQYFGAKCCLMTKQKNQWTIEQLYNDIYDNIESK